MLAVPCGRDPIDAERQTAILRTGFIKYLQEKQAAGIVNTTSPLNNQMVCIGLLIAFFNAMVYKKVPNISLFSHKQYVVHIFPACEFALETLRSCSQELWPYINEGILNEYLLVIITTVN